METRPLRWAIIGAGGMGRWHVNALLKRRDVEVVAACDVNPRALDPLPDSVRRFGDWRALLEDAELDGASVILPHSLYPDVVAALLQRGVHVLKEKPFARNLTDAVAMSRAAKASGRQLVVAGQHKFKASFEAARARLPELGQVFLTRASILYRVDSIAVEGKWGWRGTREMSGGVALVDSGWHILELVTLMRGLPSRVAASTGQMRVSAGDYDVDEQAALILEYPDGGIAVVLASFIATPGEIRLVLHGKSASLDVDLLHEKVTFHRGSVPEDLPLPVDTDPATRMYDQFIDSIREGIRGDVRDGDSGAIVRPCPGSWQEAMHVQRIVEAGYLSVARGGKPVLLEEVPVDL